MIAGLHMSNNASDSEIDSIDSSSDSSDDDLAELFMITMVYEYEKSCMAKNRVRTSSLTGREFVNELLNGSPTVCYELFRMDKTCFVTFCDDLRRRNYLGDSRDVCLEEKVAITLFILSHNTRQRVVADRFQHSTETVSRHFKQTLRAICKVGKEIIKQESFELPDHIKNNAKYYPWFKVSSNLLSISSSL